MATFRFRARVALDLRRKQDDEAQAALGDARRAVRQAEEAVAREERLLHDTLARARDEEAQACDMTRAIWYRQWMRRQRLVIEAAGRLLEERRAAERACAERATAARRRLRALERLRDRLLQNHLEGERRVEQREMDVLGGLRFVARRGAPGGA
jgi:flagellar export protein FliJ